MLEDVRAVVEDLAGGGVERDRHVVAGMKAGGLDALDQRLQGGLVRFEVGREAALVAHRRCQAAIVQRSLERVEDLGAGAQRLGEAGRADRDHHELLEVDLVVRVRAAVQHVHHRDREHVRRLAAEVAPQRLSGLGGRRLRAGQGHPQDRVGPQAALVRGAVEVEHRAIDRRLVCGVEAAHGFGQLAVDVGDCLGDSLAAPVVSAVAQLDGLELARRRARRHRRAARGARLEHHVDLDGGIAAAVDDLPRVNLLDLAQPRSTSSLNRSAA